MSNTVFGCENFSARGRVRGAAPPKIYTSVMSTPPTAVDYKPGSAPPAAATRRRFCFGPLRCIPGIKAVDHSGATPMHHSRPRSPPISLDDVKSSTEMPWPAMCPQPLPSMQTTSLTSVYYYRSHCAMHVCNTMTARTMINWLTGLFRCC